MRLLLLAVTCLLGSCQAFHYNTTSKRDSSKINVHLIVHSHIDPGWKKTYDGYYTSADQYVLLGGVEYIIPAMFQALLFNHDRRMVFAEMAYFTRFWATAPDYVRDMVKELTKRGQVEFVNGGWVQHDEACVHYAAMIDQMTRGHRFLLENLDVVPRVAFVVDNFGHSGTEPSLLTAYAGMDALLFTRQSGEDLAFRQENAAMDFVWRGARSFGDKADVFSISTDQYYTPEGFNWKLEIWNGPPAAPTIQDKPTDPGNNVGEYVSHIEAIAHKLANNTKADPNGKGNDVLMFMGEDFSHHAANFMFINLDKLIHWTNKKGDINLMYSTVSEYVAAKHSYKTDWPFKGDDEDLFPYYDKESTFWAGFYTSRPSLKLYARVAQAYLQAARQLEVFSLPSHKLTWTDQLDAAVALLQHHDAITGTCTQAVADDYMLILARGMLSTEAHVSHALSALTFNHQGKRVEHKPNARRVAAESEDAHQSEGLTKKQEAEIARDVEEVKEQLEMHEREVKDGGNLVVYGGKQKKEEEQQHKKVHATKHKQEHDTKKTGKKTVKKTDVFWQQCPHQNVSICEPSVSMSKNADEFYVLAYNPVSWPRVEHIRVPIAGEHIYWRVKGPDGKVIQSQILPVAPRVKKIQEMYVKARVERDEEGMATMELAFTAILPPMGYSIFTLDHVKENAAKRPAVHAFAAKKAQNEEHHFSVDTGHMQLRFSNSTGALKQVNLGSTTIDLTADFLWYKPYDHEDTLEDRPEYCKIHPEQKGGAYILRTGWDPEHNRTAHRVLKPRSVEVIEGPVVTVVHQVFQSWATLSYRVWQGAKHVEVEWIAGPLGKNKQTIANISAEFSGTELVVRYHTSIPSGSSFYTDANGREMQLRRLDTRLHYPHIPSDPIGGNYYPLTTGMFIEGDKVQAAVLVDRPQGGSSLKSGVMEVLLNRRIHTLDNKGMGEGLDETECGCFHDSCCPGGGLTALGKHLLVFGPAEHVARERRWLQQMVTDPVLFAYGYKIKDETNVRKEWSGLKSAAAVPHNVHVLTLQHWKPGSVLLRLAHLFEVDEHPELSKPATLKLNDLFHDFTIHTVTELSLTANQKRSKMTRLEFKAGQALADLAGNKHKHKTAKDVLDVKWQDSVDCHKECHKQPLKVVISPMTIRTFLLEVKHK